MTHPTSTQQKAAHTPIRFTNWRVIPGDTIKNGDPESVLLVADQSGSTVFTVIAQQPLIFRGAFEAIVRACNSHAALLEAVNLLVSYDDQQGKSVSILDRTNGDQDGMTPEESIYLDGIAAARAALSAATKEDNK